MTCNVQENEEQWYLWVDIDTVIIDVTFKLPFDRFVGKDFVTWGNQTRILAGDPLNGKLLFDSVKLDPAFEGQQLSNVISYLPACRLTLLSGVWYTCCLYSLTSVDIKLSFHHTTFVLALDLVEWICLPAGMNSGVMLFRKSKWSLEFLEAVAALGRIPEPELQRVIVCS